MRMTKPNRQLRRKAKTKNAIRRAALRLFLEPGFHHTNVKEIMDEADLGYGTFYQYYHSKLDVLLEQADEVHEKITKCKIFSPEEKSIYRRTYNSIYHVLSACNEHRDVVTILKNAKDSQKEIKERWDNIMKTLFHPLEYEIIRNMSIGLCRSVNRDLAVSALSGMVSGAIDFVLQQDPDKVDLRQISGDLALLFREAIFIGEEIPSLDNKQSD